MKYDFYEKVTKDIEKPHNAYGFVYIIESDNGLLKIGRSTRPHKRINAIRTQSAAGIKKIVISEPILNYAESERKLHKIFKNKRINGEWFDLEMSECLEELEKIQVETKEKAILNEEYAKIQKNYNSILNNTPDITDKKCEENFFIVYTNTEQFNDNLEFLIEHNEYEQIEEIKEKYPNLYNDIFDEDEILKYSAEEYSAISHYGLHFIMNINKKYAFKLMTIEEAKERIEIIPKSIVPMLNTMEVTNEK